MTRRPTLRHNRVIAITGEANNFLLSGYSSPAAAASVIGDVLLILLALPLGPIESRYGAWDQWILIGPKK